MAGGGVAPRSDSWRWLARLAPYAFVGAGLALAVVLLGQELERHFGALEGWLEALGPWSVATFVILFVVTTTLLVPTTLLCLLAGALFGVTWGALAAVGGGLVAAAVQYAIARHLLRDRIERALTARPRLAAIRRAVLEDELRVQVLVRLAPLNPATVSYTLGAAGVRLGRFLAAFLVLVPSHILKVYFGHAGKQLATAVAAGEGRSDRTRELVFIAGLVAGTVVLVVASQVARRALARVTDDMQGAAEDT